MDPAFCAGSYHGLETITPDMPRVAVEIRDALLAKLLEFDYYGRAVESDQMSERVAVISRYPEDRPLDDDLGLWWVLHVKPNCEKKMANYLLNRAVSYYLPILKQQVRFGNLRRIRRVEAPLFRGYLCFALEKEDHNLLYGTKKFVRIIEVKDQAGFVNELKAVARAIETQEHLHVWPGIVPGTKVMILSGPLSGFQGMLVQSRTEKELALSVKMFNQTVMVRLDPLTELEPI